MAASVSAAAKASAAFAHKKELAAAAPAPAQHRAGSGRRSNPCRVRAVASPARAPRAPASTGSVKSAMTMTEKILARASERAGLEPGENVWVDVDVLMTHDVCGPGTIGIFKKEFGEDAKVWDREKVVIIPDHYIFTSDERANRNVDILRDFCMEQNIKYFYDLKDLSNFKKLHFRVVCKLIQTTKVSATMHLLKKATADQARFSLVLILIRAMLEPLVNLQQELETPMQVLCWALERLFSRCSSTARCTRCPALAHCLTLAVIFGRDVMLVHSSGEILPLNEHDVLMKSLQMEECYYLVSRST